MRSKKISQKSRKTPRILSLKKAKNPRHGVAYYATVQSRSRGTRVNHVVTVAKHGRRLRSHCSCEIASFNPRTACDHAVAVVNRIKAVR